MNLGVPLLALHKRSWKFNFNFKTVRAKQSFIYTCEIVHHKHSSTHTHIWEHLLFNSVRECLGRDRNRRYRTVRGV